MAKLIAKGIKKLILAELGSLDEQTDEMKDLIRQGEKALGYTNVDNEELTWNGNREEMEKKHQEQEMAAHESVHGIGAGLTFDLSTEEVSDHE